MTRIEELAAALVAARRERRPLRADPAAAPVSPDEAYAVQDAVARAMHPGRRPDTWKVGAPAADAEPSAAPIFRVLDAPATWNEPPLVVRAIEAEVAFVLARDVSAAEVASIALDEAFDFACAVIEVCDARLADFGDAPALMKLADSQVNAGLVVGSGVPFDAIEDFSDVRCEVRIDDHLAFDGVSTHALGDPRVLLRWWLQHTAARGKLVAGDLVTTGTWCGMIEVPTGATVAVRMHGIGQARVAFAA